MDFLLKTPGDFGDFLGGVVAIITVPVFLLAYLQKRGEQIAEARARRLQMTMDVYEHLNTQFEGYGQDIKYQIENVFKFKPTVKDWPEGYDIFSYLRVNYFSKEDVRLEILEKFSNRDQTKTVCKRFCNHMQSLLYSIKKLNENLEDNEHVIKSFTTHPVCVVYKHIKTIL